MTADDGLSCGCSARAMEGPLESRLIIQVAGRTVKTESRKAVGMHCLHCIGGTFPIILDGEKAGRWRDDIVRHCRWVR
jgi:hypothetical protein